MGKSKWVSLYSKFLILIGLMSFVLVGWVGGHILRQFIPRQDWQPFAPEFQNPPNETGPKIKIGEEPTITIFKDNNGQLWVFRGKQMASPQRCTD